MQRPHRAIRTVKTKTRKFKGCCERCNKPIPSNKAYCHVDDTNAAMNNNALYLCAECYMGRYPNDSGTFRLKKLIAVGIDV